jgi:hypothetical protein
LLKVRTKLRVFGGGELHDKVGEIFSRSQVNFWGISSPADHPGLVSCRVERDVARVDNCLHPSCSKIMAAIAIR